MTIAEEFTLSLPDESATAAAGAAFASLLRAGDCIALSGDLGSGKTTFARGAIRGFMQSEVEVTSPTFTLVQSYETESLTLWHADFYRLESTEEVYELGVDEWLEGGALLVEWPEIAADFLPDSRLSLHFVPKSDKNEHLLIGKCGREWYSRLVNTGIIK